MKTLEIQSTPEMFAAEMMFIANDNFTRNYVTYRMTHAKLKSGPELGSLENRAAALGEMMPAMYQAHAILGEYLAAIAPLLGKTFTKLPEIKL